MVIKGVEGLSVGEVQDQVRQGGKFLRFGYCMSFLVITLKRSSEITFVRPGQSAFAAHLPYTVLSLLLGWWGFPWGFIYTPMVLIQNLAGGEDLTQQVMSTFGNGDVTEGRTGLPPVQVK